MADEQQMLSLLKGRETGEEALNRAFRSQLGDFLKLAFQAKGIGDDIGGLARSHERAREYGIEGYSQTAEPARRTPHALDPFRSKRPFTVRISSRPFHGNGDAMAHQIEIHWRTTG